MSDDIDELIDKIHPEETPEEERGDPDELLEDFCQRLADANRLRLSRFAERILGPQTTAFGLLAERPGPTRKLDVRKVEDIDTLGYQLDVTIKHLRALRDRVAFEAERRRRDREGHR